ncbi:MAG TPA: hypothetical protein VKX16_05980 [Chloroflexota bacterium]|nr:hypothetical protein [Chloroflexota bacterium]
MDGEDGTSGRLSPETEASIVAARDGGAAWSGIERQFGLTRQQARHAYQRGKRTERRAARRAGAARPDSLPRDDAGT